MEFVRQQPQFVDGLQDGGLASGQRVGAIQRVFYSAEGDFIQAVGRLFAVPSDKRDGIARDEQLNRRLDLSKRDLEFVGDRLRGSCHTPVS